MTVFLMILKIIGKVILILFLVLLVLILLTLLCPIAYRIKGSAHDKNYNVIGKVSWLFHLIGVHFQYENGQLLAGFRILFFSKVLYDSKEEDMEFSDSSENFESDADKALADTTEVLENADSNRAVDNELLLEAASLEDKATTQDTISKEKKDKPHVSLKEKTDTISKNIKEKIEALKNGIKNANRKIKRIKRLIENENNQKAFSHVKNNFVKLLKMIKPRQMLVNAEYSTGSPDTTAEVFGILAMFPIGYTNKWRLEPDFEADAFYVEGDIKLKGRMYLIVPLVLFLGLFFDRRCRRLYKRVRNI